MTYARGAEVLFTAQFTDIPGGSLVDPSAVSLRIEKDGVLVSGPYQPVTRDDVGLYHWRYTVPESAADGVYSAEWNATIGGTTQTGSELFEVLEPVDGPVILSATEVAAMVGKTEPASMTELADITRAAVAWVNRHSNEDMAPYASRKQGTKLLAARWYGRRNTTNGVLDVSDYGTTFVTKYDSDITAMLGLNTIAVA